MWVVYSSTFSLVTLNWKQGLTQKGFDPHKVRNLNEHPFEFTFDFFSRFCLFFASVKVFVKGNFPGEGGELCTQLTLSRILPLFFDAKDVR